MAKIEEICITSDIIKEIYLPPYSFFWSEK